jgi:protein phosphatase
MTTLALGTVTLNVAAVTDRGLRREANEDSFLAEGPAFVVADGMGGYESGDRASAAVVDAFRDRFAGLTLGEFAGVSDALLDADDRVAEVAAATTRGAGSTATGVVLVSHEGYPFWLVFNVGDSRVYRQAGGVLEQLTTDHSLGRELVSRGELREDELATFANRNVITRAIGAVDSLADSWLVPVVDGDRLLLCSDGLYGELDDETIRAILAMNGQPEVAGRVLVERANAHGGRDNITVMVIDVLAGGNVGAIDDTTDGVPAVFEDTLPVR